MSVAQSKSEVARIKAMEAYQAWLVVAEREKESLQESKFLSKTRGREIVV